MLAFRFRRTARAACRYAAGATTLALAGCGGAGLTPISGLTTGSTTPYVQSSIYSPTGYTSKQIDETHFTVRATGSAGTTPARLERMALTRAAEIAGEEKFAWFKVENSEPGVACGKRLDGYKGASAKQSDMRYHRLTVAYAKTQTDPTYQQADTAFTASKAALDAEAVSPEAAAAGEAEIKQTCDKR